MPRKQRHTARRVYARLVEEEGFQGSYSSVQRYVKRWREEHRSDGDGYLELDWRAGVMQVDFGEAVATIGGGDVRVHCLVATFPHSNMRYVAAMPGENAECVCEGPAQILDHIGMAPRVLVLDNATRRGPPRRVGQGHRGARVRHVLRPLPARDEVLQPVFRQRERVRRERGRLPAPQPHGPKPNAESHRQPARHLPSRCDAIADVDHYRSGRPIHELFDEERGEMQPLPRAFRRGRMSRAQGRQGGQHPDRLGPLPRGPVMARLDAARRPARVRGGDPHRRRQAREHPPRPYENGGPTVRNPATLLPALARKPNAWGESPLHVELPDGLAAHLDALDPRARRRELTLLHRAGVASGFGNAVRAMTAIAEDGRTPDEASLLALARRIAQGDPPDPDDGPSNGSTR